MDMAQALQKYCPAHGADPKDLAYFRGNLRLWLGQTVRFEPEPTFRRWLTSIVGLWNPLSPLHWDHPSGYQA